MLEIILILIVVLVILFFFVYPRHASVSVPPSSSNVYTFLSSSSSNNLVYMTAPASNAVIKNLSTGVSTLPVSTAVSPDGNEIAISSYNRPNDYYVSLIYTENGSVKTIALPEGILSPGCFINYLCQQNLAFSGNGKVLYIANIENPFGMLAALNISSGTFSNISLSYSRYGVQFASDASGISVAPNGASAYVIEPQGLVLSLSIPNDEVTGSVYINGGPISVGGAQTNVNDIVFSPDGAYAYVMYQSASNNGSIAVVNTSDNSVIANIGVSKNPGYMSISKNGKIGYLIYTPYSLSAPYSDSVSVINLSAMTVIRTINLNATPTSSAIYDNILYVAALTPSGTSSVYQINANTYSIIKSQEIAEVNSIGSIIVANGTN